MTKALALDSIIVSKAGSARRANDRGKSCTRSQARVTFLFVLLIPFIEPQIFKIPEYSQFDLFFAAGKLAAGIIVLILYCRSKPSIATVLMALCQAWILAATIINDGSLTRYAGPAITAVVMFMLAEMAFRIDGYYFSRLVRNYLSILFVANLLSCMAIAAGYNLSYPLFGMDNRWIYILLPWVALCFIVDTYKQGKPGIYAWASLLLSVLALAVLWSVGAMLALMLWPVFWLLYGCKTLKKAKINTATALFILFLILQFLLIGGYLLQQLDPIIKGLLHKDVTLSGRVYLWAAVNEVLSGSLLFGGGVQSSSYDEAFFFMHSGGIVGTAVNHPHNYFLNIGYHGGYVAMILFALVHFVLCRRIDTGNNPLMARCQYCFIACYLFASLVDTLDFSLMYLLLAFICSTQSENELCDSLKTSD